ncbi:MAG: acyl-ACP--UDP-N-acetylglucosamine O-acyltransferase [Acidobacteria bacterium]|nr:acyl-ACP--UDP-N-acetylglucosamine O-acyltransferase [Acidobacteriota bacterium]
MARIHPSAIVETGAELGEDTEIGAVCQVGAGVRLGRGCRLDSHVVLQGDTVVEEGCHFFPFSSIGQPPQDLKFRGEHTRLHIGRDNVFREFMTVHVGTKGGGGETRIGDHNYFMAYTHIAHDCQIGSHTLLANAATLAGHVVVEDHATIGAFSGVHQFCRVGRHAYIGGYSVVTQDALPFVLTVGNRASTHGINVIGLKRKQFSADAVKALRRAYQVLVRSRLPIDQSLAELTAELENFEEVRYLAEFMRGAKRGVVR